MTGATSFGAGTVAAIIILLAYLYLLFRRPARPDTAQGLKRMSVEAG